MKVSTRQNKKLIALPTEDEIGATVRCLKTEKAPGAHGMTAEVVKEIWADARQDVIDFILTLREVVGDVVDPEQKGFIKDRHITNNILNYLVSQEWAEVSEQPAIFVKLDFEKAYDRVDHSYLWETMAAMGFDEKFFSLTQGLVQGSTSKIHVNGKFSEDIQIQRGVKQGCPLAPFLFAISTQPLMEILKARQAEGSLRGVTLHGSASALYNLFADDTGVLLLADPENFTALQSAV
ncbi:hypothetical protein R1sor_016743 [Riccia sorocarpa]|uniref:Reverse transcriptase domain-containing protein n=1 Tax=Riccia sorocarpa TaxID=122646 RepID=A0ABD3HJ72_9MARC